MAFATVEDLEARWHALTEPEQARATVLLDDASVYIASLVRVDASDCMQASALKIVCCSMVQRAMNASANDAFGISQQTITADIYSQSMSFANPSGDFYLTASEKRLLGITSSYMLGIRPTIDPVEVRYHDSFRDC